MDEGSAAAALSRLQEWYVSNCDEDWEHQYGLSLQTLDNPGWMITIDLEDTHQQDQVFMERNIEGADPLLWISVKKDGMKLRGACGPSQLVPMLTIVADCLEPRPEELSSETAE